VEQALYSAPANLFVAAFIGSPPMNLVEAAVQSGSVTFADYSLPVPSAVDVSAHRGHTLILGRCSRRAGRAGRTASRQTAPATP
jgi:multiple sugar transport system ATP-binding protein